MKKCLARSKSRKYPFLASKGEGMKKKKTKLKSLVFCKSEVYLSFIDSSIAINQKLTLGL